MSYFSKPEGLEKQMFESGSDEYRVYRCEKKNWTEYDQMKYFKNFDEKVQKEMLSQSTLQPSEIPVLALFESKNWVLVTTRRVIWKAGETLNDLGYAQIRTMGWSAGPKAAETRLDSSQVELKWINDDNEIESTKGRSPWFFIFDSFGNRHELLMRPGDLIEIWNVIIFLRRLDQVYSLS